MRGLTKTRRLMEGAIRAGAIVTFVSIACADAAAAAAQNTLTLSGERRTVACAGNTLKITGQRNTVTVTGECRKVDISGTGNTVAIESVASIEVTGTNNKVTWQRALKGDNPRVSVTGLNTVTRATAPDTSPASAPSARSAPPASAPAPAPAPPAAASDAPRSGAGAAGAGASARAKPDREPAPPAAGATPPAPAPATAPAPSAAAPPANTSPRAAGSRRGVAEPATTEAAVTVLEDGREDTIECRGREVSILGSRNTLRLRGSCPMVIVTGSDNEVDVETTQRIRTTGDRNRVLWTTVIDGASTPRVENTGQQNRINKADRKPVSP
jgi:hypothetical protein